MTYLEGSGVISKTMGTYQSSKAALNRFAKTVALEEAPKGIRSNIVSPAGTGTEIWVPKEERNDAKVWWLINTTNNPLVILISFDV